MGFEDKLKIRNEEKRFNLDKLDETRIRKLRAEVRDCSFTPKINDYVCQHEITPLYNINVMI